MTMKNCATCTYFTPGNAGMLCAVTELSILQPLPTMHTAGGEEACSPDTEQVRSWQRSCYGAERLSAVHPCPGWHPGDIAWMCNSCGARRVVPGGVLPASPRGGCSCIDPTWRIVPTGRYSPSLRDEWRIVSTLAQAYGGSIRSFGNNPAWCPSLQAGQGAHDTQDPQELQDVAELRQALLRREPLTLPRGTLTLPRETKDGHQRDLLLRFFAAAEVLIKEGEAFWAMTPLVLQLRDNVQPKMLARTGVPYTSYPEESP